MIAKVLNTFSYTSTVPSAEPPSSNEDLQNSTDKLKDGKKSQLSKDKMQKLRASVKGIVISIFKDANLTVEIVKAQRLNDYEVENPRGVRLGYMGHLTYISDEVCKLFEKCAPELDDALHGKYSLTFYRLYRLRRMA